jgi:group I intron endonuclease
MACGIYKITNLVNGHCYIGQSVDIKRRWRNEKSAAFNIKSRSYNTVLSKAFRKYAVIQDGKIDFSNFNFEILEECNVNNLNEREQHYVAKYKADYNMTDGGDSARIQILDKQQIMQVINCLRTDLYKNSDQIGKEFNISGRMVRNINNGTCHRVDGIAYPIRPKFVSHPRNKKLRGEQPVKVTETIESISKRPPLVELFEQIYKTSFTSVGKVYGVSATAVQKWLKNTEAPTKIKEFKSWYKKEILHESESAIVKPIRPAAKPVKQYSLAGEFLREFASLSQAAKSVASNNYGSVHIIEVCENKRKSAYGYYWRYVK